MHDRAMHMTLRSEIEVTIKEMKKEEATGPNKISAEVWQH